MEDWAGTAEAYATSFAMQCVGTVEPVFDELGGAVSRRLLDAGTGVGTIARAARERGFVTTAFDAAADMVAYAARQLGGDVDHAALPDLPYRDDSFDVVVANFVVNHLSDPRAGLGELHRVCAVGGRCVTTIWPATPPGMNGFWAEVLHDAGVAPRQGARLSAEQDFARDEAGLAGIMVEAGFRSVAARRIRWELAIEPDALWGGVTAGIANVGAAYRSADAAGRAAMHTAYRARAAEHALARAGSVLFRYPVEAVLVTGSA